MTNLSAAPEFVPASTLSPYRFFPRLGMLVLATVVVFLAAIPELLFVPADMQAYLMFTATSGITALVLLGLFALQYRADLRMQWRGHTIGKPLRWGAIAVARVVSGGLLVPVLLHSLTEIVALSADPSFSLMGLYG